MEINSVGQSGSVSGFEKIWANPEIQEKLESLRQRIGGDSLELSSIGSQISKLMNFKSSLSETGKTEMRDFGQQILQAIESGDFDAEEMAEAGPSELKAFAEENGIDLTEMLNEIANRLQEEKKVMEELKLLAEENDIDLEELREKMMSERSEVPEKFSQEGNNVPDTAPPNFGGDPFGIVMSLLFGGEEGENENFDLFAAS